MPETEQTVPPVPEKNFTQEDLDESMKLYTELLDKVYEWEQQWFSLDEILTKAMIFSVIDPVTHTIKDEAGAIICGMLQVKLRVDTEDRAEKQYNTLDSQK